MVICKDGHVGVCQMVLRAVVLRGIDEVQGQVDVENAVENGYRMI